MDHFEVSNEFANVLALPSLDLSHNRIRKLVERLFYNLHMLEELDLSDNWIRELNPDVFRDIWRLRKLKCRRCGLKTINPLLYALLPDLRMLDLGNNEFKYLNRDEFGGLSRLESLMLDHNQISAVTDDTFRSLTLNNLSLASNRIVRVDRQAFFNTTIGALSLAFNKFESLERATFAGMRHTLIDLDLSGNKRLKISSLLLILGDQPQLRHLSLAQNNYEELPLDLFEMQTELRTLNLSNNQLTAIFPHQVAHLIRLQSLDLSHNNFKGVDGDFLDFLSTLRGFERLLLHGNPFQCDLCHIQSLLRWVLKFPYFRGGCSSDPYGRQCLRCAGPNDLVNRTLIGLEEGALEWCSVGAQPILSEDPRLGLFIGCAFVLAFLVIAAFILILRRRWHGAHYYTHEAERAESPPVPPEMVTSNGNGLHKETPLGLTKGFDNYYFSNQHHNNHNHQLNGQRNGKGSMIATIDELAYVDNPYPELDITLPPPSSYR